MALSVELMENMWLYNAGGVVVLAMGYWLIRHVGSLENTGRTLDLWCQFGFCAGTLVIINFSALSLSNKNGLPLFNQIVSWVLLIMSLAVPTLVSMRRSHYYIHRMATLFFMFACPMILLTVSYESLFYCSFAALLYCWLQLEQCIYTHHRIDEDHTGPISSRPLPSTSVTFTPPVSPTSPKPNTLFRSLRLDDTRRAFLFLFLINVAFFGTGNLASIASFNLRSIVRLVTTFAPFTMGALLVFKILVPFFLLSSVFGMVMRVVELPPSSLFIGVMATTDVMTLNFFFLVRDEGSWLDIGTSIRHVHQLYCTFDDYVMVQNFIWELTLFSHFVIACLFEVFSILLFEFSYFLVGDVLLRPPMDDRKRK
jgi:phosphatidylinositol glycan class N